MAGADLDPAERESYRILRGRVDSSRLPPFSRAVTERVIHATADFDYAADLVCDEQALAAGVAALAAGAPVIADGVMVAAGIDGVMVAAGITVRPVICKAGDSLTGRLTRVTGISPAAAAVRLAAAEAGPGAVWVVGCAPGALAEIMRRDTGPALVIGLPAGLAGAAGAKEALRASGLPSLTNVSAKGGPVAAAAAAEALLRAASSFDVAAGTGQN